MADTVEKLLQVDIHPVAVALLNVGLGLGDRLVGGTSWPNARAARGKCGVPSPLKHWKPRLLDQPVKHTRNPQLAFLPAPWFGYLHPLDPLGLVRPLESLFLDRKPGRFEKGRQFIDAQSVDSRCPLVRPDLLERSPHVATLAHCFHQVLTKPWAVGWLSRWERINPRSGSPRLHHSFPVKGPLDGLAVFHSALKMQHLLATPHRAGLQCPRAPTMPSADSYGALGGYD